MSDRRCDAYLGQGLGQPWLRCLNTGTHWYEWPGCGCKDPDPEVCLDDGFGASWECDGPHVYGPDEEGEEA